MEKSNIVLFCSPDKAYSNCSERRTAELYTEMSISEFDRLVRFQDSYASHCRNPDDARVIGQKSGRDLKRTLYLKQPIAGIRDKKVNVEASSYLFNFPFDDDRTLPDLEAIELSGDSDQVCIALKELSDFYKKFDWKTSFALGSNFPRTSIKISSTRTGLLPEIGVIEPDFLREKAVRIVKYNPNEVYWR